MPPRPGEPMHAAHRTFAALLLIQAFDVGVHLASSMLEPLRVAANVMLAVGGWMILSTPAGANGVGAANGFAFVVLNGVFIAVHGLTNPATGNLRLPMLLLVACSLLALVVHVRAAQEAEQ